MSPDTAPVSSEALLSTARALVDKGQAVDAEAHLAELLRRDPQDHRAIYLMGRACARQGKAGEAMHHVMQAICLHPSELAYKQSFVELASKLRPSVYDPSVDRPLEECLRETGELSLDRLQGFWLDHLLLHPRFRAAFQLEGRKDFDPENRKHFEAITDCSPLFLPLFLLGIKAFTVTRPVFEELVVFIRERLLARRFTNEETGTLAPAVAHYAFGTDYILDATDAELVTVEGLRARIESNAADAIDIAIFACYEPLHRLENRSGVEAALLAMPSMKELWQEQIVDHDALRSSAAAIVALTTIDDSVSAKVRAQYEEFPYPRWTVLSKARWEQARKNEEGRGDRIDRIRKAKSKVLIAGCGTGREAAIHAVLFPNASVLAVDLSRTSLAYALRKVQYYGLDNVTFAQADILQLETLNEQFDLVSSSGVLHHMQDPVRGWTVLRNILKPDGVLMLGLYSKTARRDIIAMQEIAKRSGYGNDAIGMKAFRRKSPELVDPRTLAGVAATPDYYNLSMYRDLLFHVQEHDYTIPEIADIVARLDLTFSGFQQLPASVHSQYKRRFPEDPLGLNLASWHIFEQENPTTFGLMYMLALTRNGGRAH